MMKKGKFLSFCGVRGKVIMRRAEKTGECHPAEELLHGTKT
jgi:hypothetical protein